MGILYWHLGFIHNLGSMIYVHEFFFILFFSQDIVVGHIKTSLLLGPDPVFPPAPLALSHKG